MSYQVLARKWRPQRFEEVVGQETVTKTLQNAIKSERIAHAFLFAGVRGVGKTTTARLLAKALNCQEGPTPSPCGECVSCREITEANSIDVLEIDAASNTGVDNIRELRGKCPLRDGTGSFQDFHYRRSAHALQCGLQRSFKDPGRAAAAREVHSGDHRVRQDSGDESLLAANSTISNLFLLR